MAIELIDKIKQKNGGTFKLVDSEDVSYEDSSVKEVIDNVRSQVSQIDSKKLDKTGIVTMANMGQDVKEAMTGGSVAVVGKDSVTTEVIADGQVTPIKTSFMTLGDNLFNKEEASLNGYIEYSSGIFRQHNTYNASGFIKIEEGEYYAYRDVVNRHFAFYDNDKNYIVNTNNDLTNPFITPAKAKYVRVTINDTSKAMLVKGKTIPQAYKDYEEKIYLKHLPMIPYSNLPSDIKNTTLENLTFIKSKNLFQKETITRNAYIGYSNGNSITGHQMYAHTDYMSLEGNKKYTLINIPLTNHYAFYDKDRVFIQRQSAGDTIDKTFIAPTNAKYIRITLTDTSKIDSMMMIEGVTIPQEYCPYKKQIPSSLIETSDLKIKLYNLDFLESVNLFNKDHEDVLQGHYVLDGRPDVGENPTYFVTNFISVNSGDKFVTNRSRFVHFYDNEKVYISNLSLVSKFTVPQGCCYIRITGYMEDFDMFMLNRGDILKPYSSYKPLIPTNLMQPFEMAVPKENVIGYLPKEIYVAKGRIIELYNSQVLVCTNINDYVFKWTCSVGNAMNRKFRIDGSKLSKGEHELQLKVYDKYEDVVFEATTTIKIVDNVIPRKKILCVGDSLSNDKLWYEELNSLSNGNFTFLGTRGRAPYNHEGRSGFTANGYLTPTDYTFENEGIHKFWDGERFNYAWYKAQNNIDPDVIQIFLGTNGITLNPTSNANAIKQIIDYIRQDDPNIPIFVVNTLFRANQDGIGLQVNSDGFTATNKGAYKLEEDKKVINLAVRLYELLKNYDNLYFIPIATCHDSEFNFGSVETPVNPRASQTELLPVEATHPQKQGYLQFADIMFSAYCANLK